MAVGGSGAGGRFLRGSGGGIAPVYVAGTFVLFAVLGFIVPFSGDDWTWGSHVGVDRMADFFWTYNGRYAGNLVVVGITRFAWLRALLYGTVMTTIVYGASAFANRGKRWLYWLMLALVLFMYQRLWNQDIMWCSGFANYAVSLALVMVWLNVFRGVFQDDYRPVGGAGAFVGLFVLGTVACLFLESVSITVCIASAALVAYARVRHGRWDVAQMCFLAGCVLGMVLMFSSPSYTDPDNIHNVGKVTGLYRVAYNFAANFGYRGFALNAVLNACLAATACLFARYGLGDGRTRPRALAPVAGILVVLAAYSAFRAATEWNGSRIRIADALAAIVFAACALYLAVLLWRRARDHRALFLLACAVASIAPFLMLPTSVFRVFFPEYVFLCAFALVLADRVLLPQRLGGALTRVIGVACAVGFAVLLFVYGSIYAVYGHRAADVRDQLDAGAQTVVLERLPYGRYIHQSDGSVEKSDFLQKCFRLYYEIPDDVEISFE